MANTPDLRSQQRLSGSDRDELALELLARYQRGQSIRQICADTRYSIGRVRRLLLEAGVQFRSRGGGRPITDRE